MALLPPFADALSNAQTQAPQAPVQTATQPTSTHKKRDARRRHTTRGKNYTVYITPEEHLLLTELGKRMQPDGGISVGIRFLINFFRAQLQKQRS